MFYFSTRPVLFQRDVLVLLVDHEQSNGGIVPNGRVKVPAEKKDISIVTLIWTTACYM